MYNFLEQAQVAADRQNWPLLVECLQQVTATGGQAAGTTHFRASCQFSNTSLGMG
jgi:hypothetical protein